MRQTCLSAVVLLAAAGALASAAGAQPLVLGLRVAAHAGPGVVEPPAEEPPPTPPPAAEAPRRPAEDPAVDRMIEDLERAASPRPAVEPRTPSRATPARPGVPLPGVRPVPAAPGGPGGRGAGNVVPEGTFLPSRSGRMSRSPEGQWLFTFDGGPESPAEPAMVLLPCQLLMEMETYGEGAGESAVLTVSGIVYVYYGRNYLMPTFFRPARRSHEVMPAQ